MENKLKTNIDTDEKQQGLADLTTAAKTTANGNLHHGHVNRRAVLKAAASAAVGAQLLGLGEAVAQRRRRREGEALATKAAADTGSKRLLFFTPAEFALVDELTEVIIPTDEHSPGARAAGVAAYLDRRIGETNPAIREYAQERQTWRNGLRLVDQLSHEMNGKSFRAASGEQRIAVLTRMAEEEPKPQPPRQSDPPQIGQRPTQPLQPPGQPGEIYKEGAQNRPEQRAQGSARKSEREFFSFLKAQVARAYYTSEIGLHKELKYKGNQYLKEFAGYDVATGTYNSGSKIE
ncbi:MAG: gluconate 2-dehydrogenase subunit 3 family protein [Acidobacteriota bacterium]|nr:gluconate 2-dehydrogenase subunit 3 family protein [Acidobacteriota bacterium]